MKNKKLKIILLIIFLFALFMAVGLNNRVVITHYKIFDKKVKTDFKVVFIADTHSCKYGKGQRELLGKIEKEKPDLILLGGDIIDDELPMDIGFDTIKDLSKEYPTFYVTGNHEIWSGKYEYIKEQIKSFGIEVLEGNSKEIDIKGNVVNVMGIDDPDIGSLYDEEFKNLENINSDNLTFLIAHRPERFSEYAKLHIDYVFSGHAHGGQWRLPIILEKGVFSPNQGIFPKYTVGINKFDNFSMIISRGLSRESSKVPRFYNPPELVVIEFKKNN